MKKIILLFLIFMTCSVVYPANAEKIPSTNDELVKILNQNCPIIAESIEVTMNVQDISNPAHLMVDYALYNPTNENYSLKMAIPFSQGKKVELVSNGNEISSTKRYIIDGTYHFSDAYLSMESLKTTTKVKKISYKISSEEFKNYSSLAIFSNISSEEVRFLTSTKQTSAIKNGKNIVCEIYKDQTFDIYIIGEYDESLFNWKIYKNQQLLMQEVTATVEKVEEKELQLVDVFVENNFLNIENEIDLFNLNLTKLIQNENNVICLNELLKPEEIDTYFVYNLDLSSNAYHSHTMKVEINPFVNEDYSPIIYEYLLSFEGVFGFKEINKFDLNIETAYFLIDTNLDFENDDVGYFTSIKNDEKYAVLKFSTALHPEPNLDMLELSIKIIVSSISALVLFYLVLSIKPIKKKYRLNNYILPKRVELLYLIQNALAIIAIVLSMLGMHFQILFGALSLIAILCAFILSLVARMKYQHKNVFGIAALALAISSYLNLLYQYHDLFEINTVIVSVCILVYGINNIILYNDIEANSLEEFRFLPLDFLSKKSYTLYCVYTISLMFLGMILLVFKFNVWNILILTLLVFILIILYRVIKVLLIDYKPIRNYYKTLHYDLLKSSMENKLSDDNVNPKTFNGYLIRLSEIALGNNKDDYVKYLSSFKKVGQDDYLDIECLKMNHLLTKKEFFNLYEENLLKYDSNAVAIKKVNQRYQLWLPYYSGIVEESIILQYPYRDRSNKWRNARNLFIQINYYFQKENYGKARELWKIFKEKYSDVVLFTSKLEDLHLNKL